MIGATRCLRVGSAVTNIIIIIIIIIITTTILLLLSIYNNKIVAIATECGLRRWTNGQARQAPVASGQLWAGIKGSRGGGGMAYDNGRTGARVQARLGRPTGGQTGKPTVQIEQKSRYALFWLVSINISTIINQYY